MGPPEISSELRRAGVAASTIREALREWFALEQKRVIVALATCPATMEGLLAVKADAIAMHKLDIQLQRATQAGGTNDE